MRTSSHPRRRVRRSRRGFITVQYLLWTTIVGVGVLIGFSMVQETLIARFGPLVESICGVEIGP